MSEEKADYNPADKMIKLSGKAYLQVADRIVWFRNDYPEGTIETSLVSVDEDRGSAIFRARITTGQGGVAEATGSETLKDFPQGWIEKAESKAVGRALGYLGYGTAAAGFEEGKRVVDAPQDLRAPRPQPRPAPAAPAPSGNNRIAYNDPRHQTKYSPHQAMRDEQAARRQASPLSPKAFDKAIEQAWTDMEDGKDEGSIFDTLAALQERMSEEQRLVKIQQESAIKQAIAERAAPAIAG